MFMIYLDQLTLEPIEELRLTFQYENANLKPIRHQYYGLATRKAFPSFTP